MIVVALAWRPQPARQQAHDFVVEQYRRLLPDAPLIEVDTAHHQYNLAAVRNEAVRQAEALNAAVVVLSDADCVFVLPDSLHQAIAGAFDGRLHLPYTAQRYLTEAETEAVYQGTTECLPGHHGNGACYVIQPGAYWAAGGSDERFVGWGGDDDQLVAACDTLIGIERHCGTVLSLWHADERRPVGAPEHHPNAELAARYWAAKGDPLRIRELIAER